MPEETKKTGALAAFAQTGGMVKADKKALAAALAQSNDDNTTGGGDKEYLSYSGKRSRWSIGRENKEPDPDALYVMDPQTALEGWTCWKGGKPTEKHAWSVVSRATHAIPASQLKDHGPYADGDGWKNMTGIWMFDVDEPGKVIEFTTTSASGRNSLGDITREMVDRMLADEPDIPIVRLHSEQFEAQGKTNGKPVFVVEGWATREEVAAFIEAGDDGDVDKLIDGGYEGVASSGSMPTEEDDDETAAEEPKSEEPKAEETGRRRRSRSADTSAPAETKEEDIPFDGDKPAQTTQRRRGRRSAS